MKEEDNFKIIADWILYQSTDTLEEIEYLLHKTYANDKELKKEYGDLVSQIKEIECYKI